MTRRGANTGTRLRTWSILVAGASVAAVLGVGHLVYAADGSDVAQKLGRATNVVGLLTGALGEGGDYGDRDHAGDVPFLGGAPGGLLPGLFDELDAFDALGGFNPGDTDKVQVVDDAIDAVDAALGGGKLVDRVYTCGQAACVLDTSEVQSVTRIEMRLAVGGSDSGKIGFDSLGLPSIGFLPKNAKQLDVDLSWSVNVKLIADADRLRLAPVTDQHALTLGATLTLPTDAFNVDLGALVVEATTTKAARFSGQLQVDVKDDGGFDFGFGAGSGFNAEWKLETKDSPLMGVHGTLAIAWPLDGRGVNPAGLTIEMRDVAFNAEQFVGQGMRDAVASLRTITHPIRTATSTMLEPIPGLSDMSDAIGGGDVTMLRLMEQAKGADVGNPNLFPSRTCRPCWSGSSCWMTSPPPSPAVMCGCRSAPSRSWATRPSSLSGPPSTRPRSRGSSRRSSTSAARSASRGSTRC